MTLTNLGQRERSSPKRSPGRQLFYGEPTEQTPLYPPRTLKERIEREARFRNIRDETNAWTFSRVVIDVLLDHFGMRKPGDGA